FGDAQFDQPGLARIANYSVHFLAAPSETVLSASLVGPLGFGPAQFLPANQQQTYTVEFTNAGNARSAVGEVRVVTQLDPSLDPRSFRLGDVGLGDTTIQLPEERGSFHGDYDLTSSKGFVLRIDAGIDVLTSTATWLLEAIDPNTGDVLDDATRGLFPPNNA